MSQEFLPVTRKKWISKKTIRKRTHENSHASYQSDNICMKFSKFLPHFENVCKEMETCDYFLQALNNLDESLLKLNVNNTDINRIICLGIGPITRHFQAFHQLAFVLSLQRHFGIKEAIFYDPVHSKSEMKILESLECKVLKENCSGKFEANDLTLFYMPHCPNSLTNNLLWRNWNPSKLQNLILINNSFESLTTNAVKRLLHQEAEYILNIHPYTSECPIEDDYEVQNIFNDLSIHVFPVQNMPNNSEFWTKRDEPVYDDDNETIPINSFDKINLDISVDK